MKRVVYGASGYGNIGDEAILDSIITKFSKDQLHIFSGDPKQISKKYQIKASKPSIYPLLKCNVLTIGGGGIFFDRIIKYFLIFGFIGKLFKKKLEIYAVGVTPLNITNRTLVRWLLNMADKVYVRDTFSKKLLVSYGVKKEINIIDDPAESIEMCSKSNIDSVCKKIKIKKKTIFFSGKFLLNKDKVSLNKKNNLFIKEIAHTFDNLIVKNYSIIFVPFCYSRSSITENDLLFYKSLKNEMKGELKLFKSKNPSLIKGVFSRADLLIGMRLHSLILGNKLNPQKIFALSYDHKVKSYSLKKGIKFMDTERFEKNSFLRELEKLI